MAKRTNRFLISCTEKEDKKLMQLAKQAGIPRARFVREVALGDRPQLVLNYENKKDDPAGEGLSKGEVKKMLQELSAHGNNLNQIAKHLNTVGRMGERQFFTAMRKAKVVYAELLKRLAP